jgi:hypothetical protein
MGLDCSANADTANKTCIHGQFDEVVSTTIDTEWLDSQSIEKSLICHYS